jgi:hypothetical protein
VVVVAWIETAAVAWTAVGHQEETAIVNVKTMARRRKMTIGAEIQDAMIDLMISTVEAVSGIAIEMTATAAVVVVVDFRGQIPLPPKGRGLTSSPALRLLLTERRRTRLHQPLLRVLASMFHQVNGVTNNEYD